MGDEVHGYVRCAATALIRSEKVAEAILHIESSAA
jgi:hypothetical protein